MNCEIEDKTVFRKDEPLMNQTPQNEDSDKSSGIDNAIISQSAKERLKQKMMTKEDREQALHMLFFIVGLIPQGHHVVLYGAAGSGKTTLALYLCFQILLGHKDVEVYYLYLDGQLTMAAEYENFLESKGMSERYNILMQGNIDEMLDLIEELVEKGESRSEHLVVVIDTLKYLNPNINNKDSNVKAMQRIKKLTNKGITVLSLHHTNKDGENYSGTAEIEQDGDGLLKIVTGPGDDPHTRVSTIQEGGRVRFFMEPKSYSFEQGKPASVKELNEVLDPERLKQQEEDAHAIFIIKGLLNIEGKLSKTELEKFLKEDDGFEYTDRERKRILKTYKDIHWKVTKSGNRNQYHNYSAIDHTSGTIDTLTQKIDACPKGDNRE